MAGDVLFPDRNVKRVTETSKPVDTMQDNALSLTFFPKQKEEKREGECILLYSINQFWRFGQSFDISGREQ